ncbi:helix-turn-helix domain-containing protein [Kutzneria sp. NPDC052558]|uniref:helix-turn-helix domain-containing protein n=1 Tax=Kutzneria sp. NPDC052558 TaxID=3364121 RepID=UPI0037C62177
MATRRDGLRRRREALGFTQETLAERMEVERSTVSRWERGVEKPLPVAQSALADVLEVSAEQMENLLAEAAPPARSDRVSDALRIPHRLDAVTVADLRERVQKVDERYDSEPSTNLLAETGLILGQIAFFGSHVADGRVRCQLRDVEAETMTLMGQLVWDASQRRDHDNARGYFDGAITAAHDVGNTVTEGHALLRKGYIALYGERDPKAGLALTEQTVELTERSSHVVTGLALLHCAEAHAMLEDRRACELSISQAESHLEKVDPHDPAGFMLSPSQFDRITGSCHLFLGDNRRAQQILERRAGGIQPRQKSGAIVLGNLSLARLRQGELDGATTALHEAISVLEQTRGGGGMNVVFDAARELGPWRAEKDVGDVYDRLLSLMTAA